MAQKPWVRMRTIFGESVMPPTSAAIVVRAVNRAVALGHVSRIARWQILEWWAADYLVTEFRAREAAQGREIGTQPVVSAVSPEAATERMLALRASQDQAGAIGLLVEILDSLGYEDALYQFERIRESTVAN